MIQVVLCLAVSASVMCLQFVVCLVEYEVVIWQEIATQLEMLHVAWLGCAIYVLMHNHNMLIDVMGF